jgi:hypothetical protein
MQVFYIVAHAATSKMIISRMQTLLNTAPPASFRLPDRMVLAEPPPARTVYVRAEVDPAARIAVIAMCRVRVLFELSMPVALVRSASFVPTTCRDATMCTAAEALTCIHHPISNSDVDSVGVIANDNIFYIFNTTVIH